MIHIWTLQLSRWRLAKKEGIHILNITAKSGIACFAPEMNLVMQYKNGQMGEAEYTEAYLEKMRRCYVQYRNEWERLQGIEKMAITCYCPAGQYCHRHLFKGCLTKFLDKKGTEYEDHGELVE